MHDLATGPFKFVAKPRLTKEKAKQDLLALGKKNTPAKKKKAEAATAAAKASAEPVVAETAAAATEAPAA